MKTTTSILVCDDMISLKNQRTRVCHQIASVARLHSLLILYKQGRWFITRLDDKVQAWAEITHQPIFGENSCVNQPQKISLVSLILAKFCRTQHFGRNFPHSPYNWQNFASLGENHFAKYVVPEKFQPKPKIQVSFLQKLIKSQIRNWFSGVYIKQTNERSSTRWQYWSWIKDVSFCFEKKKLHQKSEQVAFHPGPVLPPCVEDSTFFDLLVFRWTCHPQAVNTLKPRDVI